ncbi:hypothetical protein C8Q80DRAFT_184980 [Daedaleopsis nitida]|nr:hypothetical protein C8Q80DRAFT_184980 [Daedaleopsis nitida]
MARIRAEDHEPPATRRFRKEQYGHMTSTVSGTPPSKVAVPALAYLCESSSLRRVRIMAERLQVDTLNVDFQAADEGRADVRDGRSCTSNAICNGMRTVGESSATPPSFVSPPNLHLPNPPLTDVRLNDQWLTAAHKSSAGNGAATPHLVLEIAQAQWFSPPTSCPPTMKAFSVLLVLVTAAVTTSATALSRPNARGTSTTQLPPPTAPMTTF